jgi:GNAT superfamily N-acetyltransferase
MGEVTTSPGALEALQRLTVKHDTYRFDCGRPLLNDWLKFGALTSDARFTRCFVLCARNSLVIGYYCLKAGAVQHDGARRKLSQNMPSPIPVVIIGRMAIDKPYQGKGLGRALLKDALLRIVRASQLVGARAVLVQAIDHEAVQFYARYSFKPFPLNNQTLFLPMDEIVVAL